MPATAGLQPALSVLIGQRRPIHQRGGNRAWVVLYSGVGLVTTALTIYLLLAPSMQTTPANQTPAVAGGGNSGNGARTSAGSGNSANAAAAKPKPSAIRISTKAEFRKKLTGCGWRGINGVNYYGLNLYDCSYRGHDAYAEDCKVEIKATQGDRVALRSGPERLLVFRLFKDGSFEEVYNGPGAPVWALVEGRARPSNGQFQVTLAQLRRLMGSVPQEQRLKRVRGT